MPVVLFEDQVQFIADIKPALKEKMSILACAATGFGKSKVFIHIANGAIQKKKTVLILTESKKIFNQIKAEIEAELIDPDNHHVYLNKNNVYIAMAQTLANREELMQQFNAMGQELLVICDEAHMGHFNKILDKLTKDNYFLLGFTATPDARWAKHLPIYYNDIVVGPQPHELILSGRLCGCRHFARVGADLNKLVLQNGDFTEASQEAAFQNKKVFDGMFEDLRKTPYDKCMIYTASVRDCVIVSNELQRNGFKCVALHKNSKEHKCNNKEFDYRLTRFHPELSKIPVPKEEEVDIAVSVGTMTKGYDYWRINLIIWRRATTSLPLYLQVEGRGSRPNPKEYFTPIHLRGKQYFITLDYGANYLRHGLYDAERDWKDLWDKPKKSKEGVAPIKVCPQCEYIVSVGAKYCTNCNYEFEKKDIPLEVGELIEITKAYTALVTARKQIGNLEPEELAMYAKLKNKKNFAMRIARTRHVEKEDSDYLHRFAKAMGYKETWVDWQLRALDDGTQQTGFTNFVLTG
jgi:superfamily II DNA or RNA helicase